MLWRFFTYRAVVRLITLLVLASTAPAAGARTIAVPDQAVSIKAAMFQARPGDIVLVSCGTYYERDIQIKPGVSLWSGTLQPECVTIDLQGQGRAFIFDDADTNTSLVGFTVRNGRCSGPGEDGRGGAVLCLRSQPRITSCVFSDNTAREGGAVYCDRTSAPVLQNCVLTGNTADRGGAVYWAAPSGRLTSSHLRNNVALLGGALATDRTGDLLIDECHFIDNDAGNTGGAILARDGSLRVERCVFANNAGGHGGGAITLIRATLQIALCTLYGNGAEGDGAAFASLSGRGDFDRCIFSHHRTPLLRSDDDVPVLTECNLYGNLGGDWTGVLTDQASRRRNFSLDPRFCAPERADFRLDDRSPCMAGRRDSGRSPQVGALGAGCGSGARPE